MDELPFMERVRRAVARTVPHFGDLMNDHIAEMQRHSATLDHGESGTGTKVGHGSASDQAPQFLGELSGLPAPGAQHALIHHWVREFQGLGGQAAVAASGPAAVTAIVRTLQEVLGRRGGYAVVTAHPLLAEWKLVEALQAAGLPVETYSSPADRPKLVSASVGVTVASAAIAETGTLVIESDTRQGRSSSLLPPVHVAVVPPGMIVPGVAGWLADRGARYRAGEEMPSSTVLGTGPSRSADIAGDLALGVHGPGEVYAVLVQP